MTELPPAYYLHLGDGHFEPTEATTSPWDAGAQHGGPPTALLASCLDDAFGRPGLGVARVWHLATGPGPEADAPSPAPGNRAHPTEDASPTPGGPGPTPGGPGPRPEAEHA